MGKRCLLWDWTNTNGPDGNVAWAMDKVDFNGPMSSVSNWNTWAPPELKGRAPFRPMLHLEAQLSGNDWDMAVNSDQPIIHYFNEPERAGISAYHAADLWHNQVVPCLRKDKGKRLVSPSCSNDENGQAWIADFMSRVGEAPPDYLGLHYYGTDGDAAIRFFEDMHAKYNLPIIITEIASTDREPHSVLGFTAQLANWADATEWVFEIGFFGCMTHLADDFVSPAAQLMDANGNFTDLMNRLMNQEPVNGNM